jgi:hypothetical protein
LRKLKSLSLNRFERPVVFRQREREERGLKLKNNSDLKMRGRRERETITKLPPHPTIQSNSSNKKKS